MNLDFTDLLQVVSISLALGIGFLPTVLPVKQKSFQYKAWLIMAFIISLITAIGSTISKSNSDKENYNNLVSGADSTLYKVNESIAAANKIMALTNESVLRLQDIQDKNVELQRRTLAIQINSERLNRQLKEEIQIQSETNKSASDILSSITNREHREGSFAEYRFLLSVSQLNEMKWLLNDGTNISMERQSIGRYILQLLKPENKRGYRTQINNVDTLKQLIIESIDTAGIDYNLEIADTMSAMNGVKAFLEKSLVILNQEFTNPTLYDNMKLLTLWRQYYENVRIGLTVFHMYRRDFHEGNAIKQLAEKQRVFLAAIYDLIKGHAKK
jgi:hypothetical protein